MLSTNPVEAKGILRERAYRQLEVYGPGVVAIFMNTEDRMAWENEYGESLDPEVNGVPLVDDFRHPSNRVNVVYQTEYYEWEKRVRKIENGTYIAPKRRGVRKERGSDRLHRDEK